jgi:hypothetical protein
LLPEEIFSFTSILLQAFLYVKVEKLGMSEKTGVNRRKKDGTGGNRRKHHFIVRGDECKNLTKASCSVADIMVKYS